MVPGHPHLLPMQPPILLVEDNEDDRFFMVRALKKAGITRDLRVVRDGREAMEYLATVGNEQGDESKPLPPVVFLDLKLPYVSGHEVLAWIRGQSHLRGLKVVILSSSHEEVDVTRAARLGADRYLEKPPTPTVLLELADTFGFT